MVKTAKLTIEDRCHIHWQPPLDADASGSSYEPSPDSASDYGGSSRRFSWGLLVMGAPLILGSNPSTQAVLIRAGVLGVFS